MSTLSRKLKTAIHFGDVKEVKKLLKSSVKKPLSGNPFISGGYNLLNLAIRLRKKEIVKLLIKKGARVNKNHSDRSYSPLHQAVRQKYTDIVELLVKKGADVNSTSSFNTTPLSLTIVTSGFHELFPTSKIVKCLLNNGSDVEKKITKARWNLTALNITCNFGNLKHASLLVKHNANVNSKNFCNSNLIDYSVLRNSRAITNLLLKYGAQANASISKKLIDSSMPSNNPVRERIVSFGNPTLLHTAIVNQDVKMVELLVKYGADIHHRTDSFQRTPLMLAIEEYNPEIVNLLLRKGARVNVFDADGMSPLHYLICNPKNQDKRFSRDMLERYTREKLEILHSLINAGTNVNEALKPLGTKLTFFTTAATYGQAEIVRRLAVGNHLDFNLVDYDVIQATKLNINLLSREQIADPEFMRRIKNIYKSMEVFVIGAIFRRHYSDLPVNEKMLATILSKPVNDFWDRDEYTNGIKSIKKELSEFDETLKKCKIGNSSLTLWNLLTSPWDRLIIHACNNHVREFNLGDYYKQCLPYFHILRERINAAIKRSKLLEKSVEISFVLFKTLPVVCCEEILKYFNDDDLKKFNSDFDEFCNII